MGARVWIEAARPRTLPAALAPVLVGAAVCWRDGAWYAEAFVAALVGALLLQVGTNYANDLFDGVKGTDAPGRLGPRRAVAAGLASAKAMRTAFLIAFSLALLVGAWLTWLRGWPVVFIGVAAIASGILYTAGPRPLGYLGLGDLLVLAFFGPVASAGTHFVQSGVFSLTAAVAGLAPGLIAVALLTVNNLRDIEGDRAAGKRTLAVRWGARFAQAEFAACLLGAALVPVALWVALDGPATALWASAACLAGLPALRAVAAWQPGARLQAALTGTGRLLVIQSVCFSLGWVL